MSASDLDTMTEKDDLVQLHASSGNNLTSSSENEHKAIEACTTQVVVYVQYICIVFFWSVSNTLEEHAFPIFFSFGIDISVMLICKVCKTDKRQSNLPI